jgi:uncharacterized protein YggE
MVVVAAAFVLAVFAYNAVAGSHPQALAAGPPKNAMPSFFRFDGQGGDSIRPDRATIHFTTTGRGTTLVEATNQASREMRRVIAAMHTGDVARINMQTDGANGSKTSSGSYVAEQNLTVTVMKVGTTGKLIAAGITAGAKANYGPDFSSGARNSAQALAIRSAIANARRKAEAAAAAAGLHITAVISVSEAQLGYPYTGGLSFDAAKAAAPAALEVPIRRGSERVDASLTVVFAYARGATATSS